MLKFNKLYLVILSLGAMLMFITSCSKGGKNISRTTGWAYNNPKNGGFEVTPSKEQKTGPGLVFIEGGTFTMGATEETPFYEWDNRPHDVTVNSFYMDETEVSNIAYLEYIFWLQRVYGADYPTVVQKALPDTTVWLKKMTYNEPLVENYFRHPAYHNYPVVASAGCRPTLMPHGVQTASTNSFSSMPDTLITTRIKKMITHLVQKRTCQVSIRAW